MSSGDENVSDIFTPYIWNKHGLGTLIKNKLKGNYGNDLELLLIQYYVEGRFSSYLPISPKVSNYMKKSKDIAVAIGVPKILFHDRSEFERREFIVDTTIQAIKLVENRLSKRKLDIDFEELLKDLQTIEKEYLRHPEPYA
ncbi:MAG: hypothetical protein ACXVB6_13245 [Mucilaginibacter sp.]